MIPNSGTWRNQRCGRPISKSKTWEIDSRQCRRNCRCHAASQYFYLIIHACTHAFRHQFACKKKANKLIIANQKRKIQTNLLSTQKLRKRDFQVQLSHPFLPEMCCHLSLFHWLNSDPALKHVTITNYNRSPVTVMIWDIAVTCNLQCFGICSSHRTSWEY